MSIRNGEKARASVAKRNRTAQRAKDRVRRAELMEAAKTAAPKKPAAKKS